MELKGLRTLQTDIQEYTKRGISAFDLAAEEKKRGGLKFSEEEKRPSLKKLVIILIIAFLIIGAGIGGFWFLNKKEENQEPVSLLPKPILISDSQVEARLDLNSIQSAIKTPILINNILYVSITASPQEFLTAIGANPPQELIDALDNRFMLAKFYLSKDWPVLIFKINFYESAFSGMIKWEKNMTDDLKGIFSIPLETEFLMGFEDKEIQNHDTRILKDKNGLNLLVYSFINQKYLVISQDIEPLKEVFRRFSSPQYLF